MSFFCYIGPFLSYSAIPFKYFFLLHFTQRGKAHFVQNETKREMIKNVHFSVYIMLNVFVMNFS